MTVESITYINDFNPSYPESGTGVSDGDDHIRNMKTGFKNTFPNVNGAISATDEDLSRVAGANAATLTLAANASGVGTASPSEEWDVVNAAATATIRVARTGTSAMTMTSTGILATDSCDLTLSAPGVSNVATIRTAGTERAKWDASGNFIQQVNTSAPSLTTNGTMTFELTSNTSLKFSVRGSDGVTRSASLTLS
jgi:hypothetical protein